MRCEVELENCLKIQRIYTSASECSPENRAVGHPFCNDELESRAESAAHSLAVS